jgi:hypothetical protein
VLARTDAGRQRRGCRTSGPRSSGEGRRKAALGCVLELCSVLHPCLEARIQRNKAKFNSLISGFSNEMNDGTIYCGRKDQLRGDRRREAPVQKLNEDFFSDVFNLVSKEISKWIGNKHASVDPRVAARSEAIKCTWW